MAVFITKAQIKHDEDKREFTVSLGWCEPERGVSMNQELEGVGDTLHDALRDLADQYEVVYGPSFYHCGD